MANRPTIERKHKVCVICEGLEDFAYFKRLMDLNVWNSVYDFIPVNAKSASKIPARFQDAFQNDRYEVILIFCDTDKEPYREYVQVKKKVNASLNKKKAAEKLIMFANPCTMQIILSHFGDVSLKNQGKKTNGAIIKQFTGIENYDAHEEQIKKLCDSIFRRSYNDMKRRVKDINLADTVSCSTNFSSFLNLFEKDDTKWISEIQKYLKQ